MRKYAIYAFGSLAILGILALTAHYFYEKVRVNGCMAAVNKVVNREYYKVPLWAIEKYCKELLKNDN